MPIDGFNGYKAICESSSVPYCLTSILGEVSGGILDMSSDITITILAKMPATPLLYAVKVAGKYRYFLLSVIIGSNKP